MLKRLATPCVTAAMLITLSGCTQVIVSRQVNFGDVASGVTYYLPKRLHKVSVRADLAEANAKSVEKVRAKVAELGIYVNALSSKIEVLKPQVAQLQATAEGTAPGTEARKEADKKADAAAGELKGAEILKEKIDAQYHASLAELRLLEDDLEDIAAGIAPKCRYNVILKVEAQKLVPDDRYLFAASMKHNPFYDDKVVLRTTPEGLLTGATGESVDRTADVIVTIAQTAAMAFGFVGGTPPAGIGTLLEKGRPRPGISLPCPPGKSIERIVDLSCAAERTTLNDVLGKVGLRLDAPSSSAVAFPDQLPGPGNASEAIARSGPVRIREGAGRMASVGAGLFYRRDLPYNVTLSSCEQFPEVGVCESNLGSWVPIASQLVSFPQGSTISHVVFEGGGMVTSNTEFAFSEGMLVSNDEKRPSEVLALVSLPLSIARGMMSVITEVFSFRVDYASKEVALATQQLELAKALANLQAVVDGTTPLPYVPPAAK